MGGPSWITINSPAMHKSITPFKRQAPSSDSVLAFNVLSALHPATPLIARCRCCWTAPLLLCRRFQPTARHGALQVQHVFAGAQSIHILVRQCVIRATEVEPASLLWYTSSLASMSRGTVRLLPQAAQLVLTHVDTAQYSCTCLDTS